MGVCVGALLCANNHIFLGKRAAGRSVYPDAWDIPGGHCEPGESLEHALVREVEEELGVTPTVWAPLAVLHGSGPACEPYELHVFVVNSWCGTPHNCLPEEHDEVAWLTVDDACALALAHPDYPALFRAAFCRAHD